MHGGYPGQSCRVASMHAAGSGRGEGSQQPAAAASSEAAARKQSSQVCIKVLVALFRGRHGGAAVWLVRHYLVQLQGVGEGNGG